LGEAASLGDRVRKEDTNSTLAYLHDLAVKHGMNFYSHDNVAEEAENDVRER
jgi:hypothetical protein